MLTREIAAPAREVDGAARAAIGAMRKTAKGPSGERATGGERAPAAAAPATWHGAVRQFKRELLERALADAGGNRTHAARALALQRTYLLRLIRTLDVPASPRRWTVR